MTPDVIEAAIFALRRGEIVAMPTETVYGLAADATNPEAVVRIFDAKGRPRINPLIAHVSSMEMAQKEAVVSALAAQLAEAFWPGPLTLVLPASRGGSVCTLARAGLPTVALRMPAHPLALALIKAMGGPLVAPSANASGRLSPTRAAHVRDSLGDKIGIVLDDDESPETTRVGIESTIVSVIDERLTILRDGGVTAQMLEDVTQQDVHRATGADPDRPTAPGQLLAHYAPKAPLRLDAVFAGPGETLIGFGDVDGVLNLSETGDLRKAAANLFDHLHSADALGRSIAVAPIPNEGIGLAINDRLKRAAAAHGNLDKD